MIVESIRLEFSTLMMEKHERRKGSFCVLKDVIAEDSCCLKLFVVVEIVCCLLLLPQVPYSLLLDFLGCFWSCFFVGSFGSILLESLSNDD